MGHTIEIFSAGCPACKEAVTLVRRVATPQDDVRILDMHQPDVSTRASQLGIRSVPAVVVDAKVAGCCAGRGPNEQVLRDALC